MIGSPRSWNWARVRRGRRRGRQSEVRTGARSTRPGQAGAVLVACLLASGCYTGVSSFDPLDEGVPQLEEPEDEGMGPLEESFSPDPGQIRLLSAHEYANTVHDLLGVEASDSLDFGEVGSGYDNGSEGQLGESLFSILLIEAERLASVYVAEQLAADYPCFTPEAGLGGPCIETIVDGLGRRAFRRPLDPTTRQQLLDFVDAASDDADDATALAELLVTRMLVSPRFLYRTEIGTAVSGEPELHRLDPFEMASLLSYSLVGSMPDEELLADAEADQLDADTIRDHVRRLLDSPRGRAQLVKFFAQWLRVEPLDAMVADPDGYPKLASAAQATSLRDEFAAFVSAIVVDDQGTLEELLTRNVAFVDRHTATLYGLDSQSDELEPRDLDASQRGGILTLASVMAVHSSSAELHRDKPIRRGLLVKNQLLCESVGLPSGLDVQSAAEDAQQDVSDFDEMTTREQLQIIMNQSEECVACHSTFMPFGYLWSNFDAMGQYQTHHGDRLLDSYVEDLQIDGEVRSYDGVMDLVPQLAAGRQLPSCFGRNLARYATGRADGELVEFLTEALTAEIGADEMEIVALVEDLFASPELYIREAP